MRLNQQARQQVRAQARSATVSQPAPSGGWNTISAISAMPEEDAVTLDNWYPDLQRVRVRMGYESFATGIGSGLVQTVVEYNQGSNRKLLAASSSNIYNATAGGDVSGSSLLGSQSNGRWQTAMLGANQLWANGADTPQVFDGSSFSSWTGTGSGLTPASVIGCLVHKQRMYVWMANSSTFYYGAASTIGGTYTAFPLGEVSQIGGNIVAAATWTLDSGSGPDDFIVFLMSSGQIVVYQGNDPGDADAWALVGIYKTGAPLGIRAVAKDGADLRFITHEDITNLTETIGTGDDAATTTKVKSAVAESAAGASGSFGWEICHYPRGGMVIHNIPQASGSIYQYVQNMTTKAWCRYTGIEAQCWALFNNELYFGGSGGVVYKAETGNDDNGTAIEADAITAWTPLGVPNRKQVKAIRVVINAAELSYNFGLGFDFRSPTVSAPQTISQTGTPWGSPWGSSWSQENTVSVGWKIASGTGDVIATRLRVSSEAETEWLRTDFRVEPARDL